jgi:predicted MFS family arabinose efflux permease
LFSASIYWGSGVGGLGNFIIDMAGWRNTYLICGGSGIFIGFLSLFLLKET